MLKPKLNEPDPVEKAILEFERGLGKGRNDIHFYRVTNRVLFPIRETGTISTNRIAYLVKHDYAKGWLRFGIEFTSDCIYQKALEILNESLVKFKEEAENFNPDGGDLGRGNVFA